MDSILTRHGYPVISRLLGLTLLAAGLLKGHELITAPEAGTAFAISAGVAGFEVLFGCWLVAGLLPRFSWWLAVACLVTFLGVSFDRAMAGETSCGCFGRIHLPPWYTFAFDTVALVGLICAQPHGTALSWKASRGRWAAFLGLSFASFAGLAVALPSTAARLQDDGEIVGTGGEVQLQPNQWVGQRFPLVSHIDNGTQFLQGRWAVMFYRADCSSCRAIVPQYFGLAYQLASQTRAVRLALVEIPPYAAEATSSSGQNAVCLRGRLADTHRWQLPAPTFVLLDNGTVTKTTDKFEILRREFGATPPAGAGEAGFLLPDYRQIRRELFLSQIACGPLALLALLQEFGLPPTQQEADRLLAEAGDKGIDLLRLKELVEQHGLQALGVTTSTEELRRLGQRAIVHLDGVGFAAVTGYTAEGVVLVQPLQPPGVLPDDLFTRAFGKEGKALLVSREPLRPDRLGIADPKAEPDRPGPRLGLARSVVAVGRVHRRNWEASLPISNEGTETLHIDKVVALCPCMQASVDRIALAPGESALLHVKGTNQRLGGFLYSVELTTNAGDASSIRVPVRGYAEAPVGFGKPTVFFRGLLPRQRAGTELELDLPAGLDPSRLRVKAKGRTPFAADLRLDAGQAVLMVQWTGADRPGLTQDEIEVAADPGDDAIAARLPCTAEVVQEFEVFPSGLVIAAGLGDGETWKRTLRVESHRALLHEPRVEWVEPQVAAVCKAIIARSGEHSFSLELSGSLADLRRVAPTGTTLNVTAGSGMTAEVPVRIETTER